ncbi:glycosyltransferase family 2 protein [Paraburkholderia caballeronis]|uniref:Glycosyltransferase, GT2 family n=1 Tax=Paraburkholderia caballeronis TaxID=416943 RepID=A0A1H7ICZ3_9BURK|nr:glycosyltransferase family A protein [Paraburkholderia caballeronis]PXW29152.1 GT2 family glycosyltransferase [Paraburkholderia caballeronis]PXX04411.1 GT2 family glycosyltransferase [Paraburkholderia caballeronis]RAK05472.1 GT2 family glycosyltransferase [Paraburkholderia caballeronis]TDV18248.1 GT2 family glycosyltransferase [Paraburkholderia caballeronis]TDV20214.1 GT2 family glycosyltransferase [Paraburkholderia caballeronis]
MTTLATDDIPLAATDDAKPRLRVSVVIATKGRPAATAWAVRLLARQTVRPDQLILSGSCDADIGPYDANGLRVDVLIGTAGSSVQRNRALDALAPDTDVVIFFDDDFAPERHWIEQCADVFAADPSLAGLSGRTLRDGATGQPVAWEEALTLVDGAEAAALQRPPLDPCTSLYGCNMACRVQSIGDLRFDERLVLYGWLEDKDFSRRLSRRGRLVRCNYLLGVHLGMQGGRVSGRKFGYSQVVNAMYLCRKGVLSRKEAASNIVRALGMNCVKSVRPEAHLDRRGRLIGNVIGIAEMCLGSVKPERAARL